jgi:hypothetical protein
MRYRGCMTKGGIQRRGSTVTEEAGDVASDLLAKGLLRRYLECPICGCSGRIPMTTPFHSNGYVAAAASRLGISAKSFVDSMLGQKCLSCGALYFDPWLSLSFQKELYEELFPQHNMGWEILWSILKDPTHRPRDTTLFEMIRKKVPTLHSYAEIGCPFTGLIPYLGVREYQYGSKTFFDYPGHYPLKSVIGLHPVVNGLLHFERFGNLAARFFNQLQLLRVFPLKRLIKRCLIRFRRAREIWRHETQSYYISHDSSFLWGKSCKSLGVDCRRALKNIFGVQIVSLEEVQTEKLRFDLVGIFNSLDHFRNPISLLRQVFQFTDYIYLEGHCAEEDWGKQHLYFLEKDVFRMLPSVLPGGEAIADFKGRGSQHWYSILLKKNSDQPI